MKIGIVGGGAIGLLMAAYLGREHHVHLYVRRNEQKELLQSRGVICRGFEAPTYVTASISGYFSHHDVIMVAVKQHQIENLVQASFPEGVPLLFLQNGMGHLDHLPIDRHPCMVGVLDHGALKDDDVQITHTGHGQTILANYMGSTKAKELAMQLNQPEFPFLFHEDAQKILVDKLVVNAVINPLTALFQVKNNEIVTNPYISNLAKGICREVCDVFSRSFEHEWKRVVHVASNTGENQSSMLKDIQNGRKTEVEAITGYIVQQREGRVPYNQFVLQAIHALEERGKP